MRMAVSREPQQSLMETAPRVSSQGALSVIIFAGVKRMMGMRMVKRSIPIIKGIPAIRRRNKG